MCPPRVFDCDATTLKGESESVSTEVIAGDCSQNEKRRCIVHVGPYIRRRVAGEHDLDAEPLALCDALQVGNGGQEQAALDAEAARVEAHRDRVVAQRRGHHAAGAVLLRVNVEPFEQVNSWSQQIDLDIRASISD